MALNRVDGKVIVAVDLESKNSHRFSDGTTIRLERQWNNLNKRETHPVNAIAISGDGVKEGSEILIHPNMTHDAYRIFDYEPFSGKSEASDVKYYSIPVEQCYAWLDGDTWKPLYGFDFALRVYTPYEGKLEGIEPSIIKDVLYVTTGEFTGKVIHTLKSSDYEIIFQNVDGREGRIIRFRHFPDHDNEREEVIAINDSLTRLVKNKKLLVGLTPTNAKTI